MLMLCSTWTRNTKDNLRVWPTDGLSAFKVIYSHTGVQPLGSAQYNADIGALMPDRETTIFV